MGGILAACEFFTPERGPTLGILCIVLVGLLVGAIFLGFGPLRGRLGLDGPDRSADRRSVLTPDGLLGIWCLLRELRRPGVPSEDFSHRERSISEGRMH